MNAWRSPGRILRGHAENQGANLYARRFPAAQVLGPGAPFPVEAEAGPMPIDNRPRCDQDERLLPSGPEASQGNPEKLMRHSQPCGNNCVTRNTSNDTSDRRRDIPIYPTTSFGTG